MKCGKVLIYNSTKGGNRIVIQISDSDDNVSKIIKEVVIDTGFCALTGIWQMSSVPPVM